MPRLINDIPTSDDFDMMVARATVGGTVNGGNASIAQISMALRPVESLRNVQTLTAIFRMRDARRPCNAALKGTLPGHIVNQIKQVRDALSEQIDKVATVLLGAKKAKQVQKQNARAELEAIYDRAGQRKAARIGAGLTLHSHYGQERQTESHLPTGVRAHWLASKTRLGIDDYYETVYTWRHEDGERMLDPAKTTTPGPQGIKYLTHKERQAHKFSLTGGRFLNETGTPFHSGPMKSLSGPGWAIFAVGYDREFYFGGHQMNKFHHSSFFAGGPVLAAGEMAVHNGYVVGVTAKTGHYRAGPREMKAVLQLLQAGNVRLNSFVVSEPVNSRGHWFLGQEVLAANGDIGSMGEGTMKPPQPVLA